MERKTHPLALRAVLTALSQVFDAPALQSLTDDERADVLIVVAAELGETPSTKAAVRFADALALLADSPHQALLLVSDAFKRRRARDEELAQDHPKTIH